MSTVRKPMTSAHVERQHTRDDDDGRYSKLNPCYSCGHSAGANYFSAARTDTAGFGDLGLVLCKRCCGHVDAMKDNETAIAFLQNGVQWGGTGPAWAKKPRVSKPAIEKLPPHLAHKLAVARDVLDSHMERMRKNPFDAFHWINGPVEASATVQVVEEVHAALKSGRPYAEIAEHARNECLRIARSGAPHGSAFLGGVLHAELIRAWADVCDPMHYQPEAEKA